MKIYHRDPTVVRGFKPTPQPHFACWSRGLHTDCPGCSMPINLGQSVHHLENQDAWRTLWHHSCFLMRESAEGIYAP